MFVKNVAFVFIFFLCTCLLSSYTVISINDLKNKMNIYRTCFAKENERSVTKTNVKIKDVVTNIYNSGNHYLRLNFKTGILYPSYYIVISDVLCIDFFDKVHNRIFSASCTKLRYSEEYKLIEFSGNVTIVMENTKERINVENVIFDMSDGKFYSDAEIVITRGDNDIMCGQGFIATSQLDVNIYNIKYHGKNDGIKK